MEAQTALLYLIIWAQACETPAPRPRGHVHAGVSFLMKGAQAGVMGAGSRCTSCVKYGSVQMYKPQFTVSYRF